MRTKTAMRAVRGIFAMTAVFGIGGGCLAIYGFDEFEKKPPISCKEVTDCPGSDLCGQRVCEKGICKIANPAASGVVPPDQPRGDCQRITCDGNGNAIVAIDNLDVPKDGEVCTDDVCNDGAPGNPDSAAGTKCGLHPSIKCTASGECYGCGDASECGTNGPCVTWVCENAVCIRNVANYGTFIADAVAGDCRVTACDVVGEEVETFAPNDAPSDGDPCTTDTCLPGGTIENTLKPAGTTCGECKACSPTGTCDGCDPITSDCYENVCIAKPKTCTSASECESKSCVDGFCCNSECKGTCMACTNELTGKPSGFCASVTNGTDPRSQCNSPAEDVCVDGACQCSNGILDGLEVNVDCGGTCAPCNGTWKCGGVNACDGNGINPSCCGSQCNECVNNSGICKSLEGQPCALGSQQQSLTLGTVFNLLCPPYFTACKGAALCTCVP